MRPRIAAAQLSHETNVFSAVPTDLAAFQRSGIAYGADIPARETGTNSAFGGFIPGSEAAGFDLIPILSVWATPSGMVTAEAFDTLTAHLIDGIAAAGAIDGVLIALHGAMVSERERDADGAILERLREAVGWDVPIVCTLDLHANISARMVTYADVLIGYDTYPHIDMADRAREACSVLARLIRGEIAPVAALVKPPMLPTSQRMPTDQDPMRSLISRAHQMEADPRVINVTIAGGFPPADVEEAGLSIVVTADNDAGLAEDLAVELGELAWELREGFLGGVSSFTEAAIALNALPPVPGKPLVLVDIGDNPWTGGPGDSAELVRFLVTEAIAGAAVAIVSDPESAARCVASGLGATVDLDLGGKTDKLHGDPLRCSAYVRMLSDGRYINDGPMMAGLTVDLGPSAVVVVGDPGVQVIVTSRAETPIDLNIFRRHGIEPTVLRVIGLKGKGHFRAAFAPIARDILLVEGPGITGADLTRLPFRHVARPIWPLDPDANWD